MTKFFIKIKNYIKRLDKYYLLLFLIILAAFFISLDDLKNPMIAEPDAYSRFNISLNNFKQKNFFQIYTGAWLPLHFSILSLSFFLGENGPRIINFIFNILSILSLYFYSLNISKNKKTAILSSFFYLLLTIRIVLATQTLTESIFIFLIISSLHLLLKDKKNYLLGIVLLLIAQGIRFEAWFILPFIFLIILTDKKINKIEKINYLLMTSIFPIFWLYINNQLYKDSLFFFHQKKEAANKSTSYKYFNLRISFLAWYQRLKTNLHPLLASLVMIPIFFKKRNKKEILSSLIALYFFIILILQVYLGSMEWEPHRYLLIPITLSLPTIANSIIKISKYLEKTFNKKIKSIFLLGVIVFQLFFTYYHFQKVKNQMNKDIISNKTNFEDLLSNFPQFYEKEQNISYFYSSYNRKWLEQPFFYFLEKENITKWSLFGNYYEKDQLKKRNNGTLVWEKEDSDEELNLEKNYKILYENEIFLIMEKKSNQK